jgi:4-hydroxy-tetrahydrodipicolinate synthase
MSTTGWITDDGVGPGDPNWRGIFPSLPTPFHPDGELDIASMRRVVGHAVDAGAHGLVCFGLAGEVSKLTPKEREVLAEVVVEAAAKRVPVLFGVGSEATHTSAQLASAMTRAGAAGLIVPAPSGSDSSPRLLRRHIGRIADASSLPVVIQDAAAYIGTKVSPALALQVARQHENIQYVKIEAGPEETGYWVAELEGKLRVFTGDAGIHLIGCLGAGAIGNMPGADLIPQLLLVYEAVERRQPDASRLMGYLLPYLVFALQGIDHYNASAKAVLRRCGVIEHDALRQPSLELSPLGNRLVDELYTPIAIDKFRRLAADASTAGQVEHLGI